MRQRRTLGSLLLVVACNSSAPMRDAGDAPRTWLDGAARGLPRDASAPDVSVMLDAGLSPQRPSADASHAELSSSPLDTDSAVREIPYLNPALLPECQGRSRPGVTSPVPRFKKQVLRAQPGAAYLKPRDLDGDSYPEFLLTTLTEGLDLTQLAAGPPLATGGAYVLAREGGSVRGTLGRFTTRTAFDRSANIAWPNASESFDVDNDGTDDWIIGAGFLVKPIGALVWLKGSAGGTFGPVTRLEIADSACWYHEPLPLDLDRDGDMDFITSCHVGTTAVTGASRLEWFENPGDASGAFVQHAIGSGGGALLTLFDVDGDGDQDILAPQFFEGESLVWFENTSDIAFVKHVISQNTGRGFIVRLADINGDGRTDIVYGNHNNEAAADASQQTMGVYWFEVPPGSSLGRISNWNDYRHTVFEGFEVYGDGNGSSAGAPGMLNVGDIDGDCDIDITASGDGDIGLYVFVQGEEGFTPLTLDSDPSNVNSGEQHVLDLDEDGDVDIVWAVFGPNDPAVLLSSGLSSKVFAFLRE